MLVGAPFFKTTLFKLAPLRLQRVITFLRRVKSGVRGFGERSCNVCGFYGYFTVFGRPLRVDALCPQCSSLERHRLLALVFEREVPRLCEPSSTSMLHFAAEPCLKSLFTSRFRQYKTADLYNKADLKLNIEKIDLESKSVDVVVANHVLEHVDDFLASAEVFRILKSGGLFVCQVPIVEGWSCTYENPEVADEEGRWLHFGQGDHVRYYGADFKNRIMTCGFSDCFEFTSDGTEAVQHGLIRGEKVFIFKKSK